MTGPETVELAAVDAALAGRPVAPEHAELAELALLLRDERPEPALRWTTEMDRRVEAGFRRGARSRHSGGCGCTRGRSDRLPRSPSCASSSWWAR
jgi:hypothetical protein